MELRLWTFSIDSLFVMIYQSTEMYSIIHKLLHDNNIDAILCRDDVKIALGQYFIIVHDCVC